MKRCSLTAIMRASAGLLCLAGFMPEVVAAPACLSDVANHFRLPMPLLEAVLKVEGGRPGLAMRNSNGTYDLGPMQINTSWLPVLAEKNITREMLRDDFCVNVAVGAWILARELNQIPAKPAVADFWQAVGRYNSRTPRHNYRYAVLVWKRLKEAPKRMSMNLDVLEPNRDNATYSPSEYPASTVNFRLGVFSETLSSRLT